MCEQNPKEVFFESVSTSKFSGFGQLEREMLEEAKFPRVVDANSKENQTQTTEMTPNNALKVDA